MNKRKLYESIVNNVSRELRKTLNEDFQFDDTEVADKLLELVKKDKQIQNITKNATAEDWAGVIRGMVKLVKSKKIGENPTKIANVVQLANAILNRGLDKNLQQKLVELQNEDIQYTANFLANEVRKTYGENDKKAIKGQDANGNNDDKPLVDNKQDNAKNECGDAPTSECGAVNKKVNEAKGYRRTGGFTKFLNENRRKGIRPGKQQPVDEDFKSAAVGAALGAASLFGGATGAKASPMADYNSNNQSSKTISVQPKFSFDELVKMFPEAYKERSLDPKTWSRHRIRYEGKLPNNKMAFVGVKAAANGENPWEAILAKYLDTRKSTEKMYALNDVDFE